MFNNSRNVGEGDSFHSAPNIWEKYKYFSSFFLYFFYTFPLCLQFVYLFLKRDGFLFPMGLVSWHDEVVGSIDRLWDECALC